MIVGLRKLRFTAAEIAETLAMALSTVSGILTRRAWGGWGGSGSSSRSATSARVRASSCMSTSSGSAGSRAAPASVPSEASAAPAATTAARTDARRRAPPPRSAASTCTSRVDDYSRLAYAEVLPDEKHETAIGFLQRAVAFYRPLRDHGRAAAHRQRLRLRLRRCTPSPAAALGIRHLRTRPYRPQTNGKAERFIRTLARRLGLRRHLPLEPRTHSRP